MSTHTIPHPPKPTTAGKKATAIATELKHLGILPFGDVLQRHMEKSSPKDPGTPLSPTIPVLGVFLDGETLISTTADRALRAAARAGDRSQFEAMAGQAQIRPEAVARAWDTYTAPPPPPRPIPPCERCGKPAVAGLPRRPYPRGQDLPFERFWRFRCRAHQPRKRATS